MRSAKQKVTVKQGIEQPVAKKIIAEIKAAKLKVETQINGEKLRISGKKKDDLQLAMALLRKSETRSSRSSSTISATERAHQGAAPVFRIRPRAS